MDRMDCMGRARRDLRRRRRICEIRTRSDPFVFMDDVDFPRTFRFTKQNFLRLTDLVSADLLHDNNRGLPDSPLFQVLVFALLRLWIISEACSRNIKHFYSSCLSDNQESLTFICFASAEIRMLSNGLNTGKRKFLTICWFSRCNWRSRLHTSEFNARIRMSVNYTSTVKDFTQSTVKLLLQPLLKSRAL